MAEPRRPPRPKNRASPKSRKTAELYKSSHNIGNRTAADRVGSYKETEVALVYPEGFWDAVKPNSDESDDEDSSSDDETQSPQRSRKDQSKDKDRAKGASPNESNCKNRVKEDNTSSQVDKGKSPQRSASKSKSPQRPVNKKKSPQRSGSKSKSPQRSLGKKKSPHRSGSQSKSPQRSKNTTNKQAVSNAKVKPNSDKTKLKKDVKVASDKPKENKKVKGKSSLDKADSKNKKSNKRDISPEAKKKLSKNNCKPSQMVKKCRKPTIRPRAPRIKRTACLNAGAIVSLLYEHEEPAAKKPKVEVATPTPPREIFDFTSDDSMSSLPDLDKSRMRLKELKKEVQKVDMGKNTESQKRKRQPALYLEAESSSSSEEEEDSEEEEEERKKRKEDDIPLWPPPKRMASLNAQAIWTATSSPWRRIKTEKSSQNSSHTKDSKDTKEESDSKDKVAKELHQNGEAKVKEQKETAEKAEVAAVKEDKTEKLKEPCPRVNGDVVAGGNQQQSSGVVEGRNSVGSNMYQYPPDARSATQQGSYNTPSSLARARPPSPDIQIISAQMPSRGGSQPFPYPPPSPDVQIIEVKSPPRPPYPPQRQQQPRPQFYPSPRPVTQQGHNQGGYPAVGYGSRHPMPQQPLPPQHHMSQHTGQGYYGHGGQQSGQHGYSQQTYSSGGTKAIGMGNNLASHAYSQDPMSQHSAQHQQADPLQQGSTQQHSLQPLPPSVPSGSMPHNAPLGNAPGGQLQPQPQPHPALPSRPSPLPKHHYSPGSDMDVSCGPGSMGYQSYGDSQTQATSPMGSGSTYQPYSHHNGSGGAPVGGNHCSSFPFSGMESMNSYHMMSCHRPPRRSAFSVPSFNQHQAFGYYGSNSMMQPMGDTCCVTPPFSYHVHQQQVKVLVHNPSLSIHTTNFSGPVKIGVQERIEASFDTPPSIVSPQLTNLSSGSSHKESGHGSGRKKGSNEIFSCHAGNLRADGPLNLVIDMTRETMPNGQPASVAPGCRKSERISNAKSEHSPSGSSLAHCSRQSASSSSTVSKQDRGVGTSPNPLPSPTGSTSHICPASSHSDTKLEHPPLKRTRTCDAHCSPKLDLDHRADPAVATEASCNPKPEEKVSLPESSCSTKLEDPQMSTGPSSTKSEGLERHPERPCSAKSEPPLSTKPEYPLPGVQPPSPKPERPASAKLEDLKCMKPDSTKSEVSPSPPVLPVVKEDSTAKVEASDVKQFPPSHTQQSVVHKEEKLSPTKLEQLQMSKFETIDTKIDHSCQTQVARPTSLKIDTSSSGKCEKPEKCSPDTSASEPCTKHDLISSSEDTYTERHQTSSPTVSTSEQTKNSKRGDSGLRCLGSPQLRMASKDPTNLSLNPKTSSTDRLHNTSPSSRVRFSQRRAHSKDRDIVTRRVKSPCEGNSRQVRELDTPGRLVRSSSDSALRRSTSREREIIPKIVVDKAKNTRGSSVRMSRDKTPSPSLEKHKLLSPKSQESALPKAGRSSPTSSRTIRSPQPTSTTCRSVRSPVSPTTPTSRTVRSPPPSFSPVTRCVRSPTSPTNPTSRTVRSPPPSSSPVTKSVRSPPGTPTSRSAPATPTSRSARSPTSPGTAPSSTARTVRSPTSSGSSTAKGVRSPPSKVAGEKRSRSSPSLEARKVIRLSSGETRVVKVDKATSCRSPTLRKDKASPEKSPKTKSVDKVEAAKQKKEERKTKKDESTKPKKETLKTGVKKDESKQKSENPKAKKEDSRGKKDDPKHPKREESKSRSAKSPTIPRMWCWDGEPFWKPVYNGPDSPPVDRKCYPAVRHIIDGDVVQMRDCVLVRSGPRKTDIPYVAKIATLWEAPETADMMMSVMWYYRPEHTESEKLPRHISCEIFASKHRDQTGVACIDDKCHVLTFNEYCRYRADQKRVELGMAPRPKVVPDMEAETPAARQRMPGYHANPETVFLCRRVYDVKLKRVLKNPTPS